MQRDDALSRLIGEILLVLAVWGLLASLLLYLIDVRSIFIEGGETRLRIGILAFAAGVILIERLHYFQGPTTARAYALLLGVAITIFAVHHAYAYRLPTHPLIVFLVNEILFVILWISGHRITRACAVRTPELVEAAGDAGIFGGSTEKAEHSPRFWGRQHGWGFYFSIVGALILIGLVVMFQAGMLQGWYLLPLAGLGYFVFLLLLGTRFSAGKRRVSASIETPGEIDFNGDWPEAQFGVDSLEKDIAGRREGERIWSGKLGARHPGRVIFRFALFTLPLFGLGVYLFEMGRPAAQLRLGAWLFIYLWSAMALLCLASLNQLRAYFEARRVGLPELVGLVWLAVGLGGVCVLLLVSFFLPQPPTAAGDFVRQRILGVYRGWEEDYGIREELASRQGTAAEGADGKQIEDESASDKTGAGGGENRGAEEEARDLAPRDAASNPPPNDGEYYDVSRQRMERIEALKSGFTEKTQRIFDAFLRVLMVVMGVCAFFLALLVLYLFGSRMRVGIGQLRRLVRRGEKKPRPPEKRVAREGAYLGRNFGDFADPFAAGAPPREAGSLARYIWEALLAWCEEGGSPKPAEQTPLEFVSAGPAALAGVEEPARRLAELFSFSEFAGQPLPDSARAELQSAWRALAGRARGGG